MDETTAAPSTGADVPTAPGGPEAGVRAVACGADATDGANMSDSGSDSPSDGSDSDSSDGDNMFMMEGLTAEQKAKMRQAFSSIQDRYEQYAQRKKEMQLLDIAAAAPELSKRGCEIALEACNGDEMEAIARLQSDKAFVECVQDLASKPGDSDSDDDDNDDAAVAAAAAATGAPAAVDGTQIMDAEVEELQRTARQRLREQGLTASGRPKKKKVYASGKRLQLDEALNLLVSKGLVPGRAALEADDTPKPDADGAAPPPVFAAAPDTAALPTDSAGAGAGAGAGVAAGPGAAAAAAGAAAAATAAGSNLPVLATLQPSAPLGREASDATSPAASDASDVFEDDAVTKPTTAAKGKGRRRPAAGRGKAKGKPKAGGKVTPTAPAAVADTTATSSPNAAADGAAGAVASSPVAAVCAGATTPTGSTDDAAGAAATVGGKGPLKVKVQAVRTGRAARNSTSMKLTKEQEVMAAKIRELGWSEARIKAYLKREENPNAYYYRFNEIGEVQATGNWSPEEKALFFKLIQEKPVDYQWGTFSRNIPGRVGYQCSNFYRSLIMKGEIEDPNYTYENGKLTFQFGKKNKASKITCAPNFDTPPTTARKPRAARDSAKKRKPASRAARPKRARPSRPRAQRRDDGEDSGGEYHWTPKFDPSKPCALPGFKDPMTGEQVVEPAISPQFYVMGYYEWLRCLNREPKNQCPFTRNRVTRRNLVKLTPENVDQYKDKIVNRTRSIAEVGKVAGSGAGAGAGDASVSAGDVSVSAGDASASAGDASASAGDASVSAGGTDSSCDTATPAVAATATATGAQPVTVA